VKTYTHRQCTGRAKILQRKQCDLEPKKFFRAWLGATVNRQMARGTSHRVFNLLSRSVKEPPDTQGGKKPRAIFSPISAMRSRPRELLLRAVLKGLRAALRIGTGTYVPAKQQPACWRCGIPSRGDGGEWKTERVVFQPNRGGSDPRNVKPLDRHANCYNRARRFPEALRKVWTRFSDIMPKRRRHHCGKRRICNKLGRLPAGSGPLLGSIHPPARDPKPWKPAVYQAILGGAGPNNDHSRAERDCLSQARPRFWAMTLA